MTLLLLEQMGWGEPFIPWFTGPPASSGVANPSPTSHSRFRVLAHYPSLLSCLQTQTHSLISSISFTSLLSIWPPGRCMALEQALLIEHLFRHGAGSVACGRAAGGSSMGDIMSYYVSWDVLFTCKRAHFTGTLSNRQSHATTISTKIIGNGFHTSMYSCMGWVWEEQQQLQKSVIVVISDPGATGNILASWIYRGSQTDRVALSK